MQISRVLVKLRRKPGKNQVMALAVKAVFLAPGHRRRAGLATPNRPNAQKTVSN